MTLAVRSLVSSHATTFVFAFDAHEVAVTWAARCVAHTEWRSRRHSADMRCPLIAACSRTRLLVYLLLVYLLPMPLPLSLLALNSLSIPLFVHG